MHFLSQLGLFFAQAIIILVVILIAIAGILAIIGKNKSKDPTGKLSIKHLNEEYNKQHNELLSEVDSKAVKELEKSLKTKQKSQKKDKNKEKKRIYYINFDGDTRCTQVKQLRKCITATLQIARPSIDEVLLSISSGGGLVNTYGLAAAQCQRVRDADLKLTVSIDKVAASGGYLMATVANHIIAAPFAIIGSIGVVMQLPNFNRWLKKQNVDYECVTAGEYKRTLTLFGENTKQDREKTQEDVNAIHTLFKDYVSSYRPNLDIEQVATGEHWYGSQALELNLIDAIQTSDDYICTNLDNADIYQIEYKTKKKISQKLADQGSAILRKVNASLEQLLGKAE